MDGMAEFTVLAFSVGCYCHGVKGISAIAFFVDGIVFFITDEDLVFEFCAYSFYEIVNGFGIIKCDHICWISFLSFCFVVRNICQKIKTARFEEFKF